MYKRQELKEGKSAGVLMALADQYEGYDEDQHYSGMAAAFTNIRCTDSNRADEPVDEAKLARARKLVEAYDAVAPFQRASVSPGRYDVCDFWKFKGTLPKPQKLSKVPNILVISTTHDPATPYGNGPKVAEMIDGSLLSVAGVAHGAYGGVECVNTTVNTFFNKGRVPRDGEFGEKLKKPDSAKDHRGKTVTLSKRCKMQTFRADGFVLSASKAHVGQDVRFSVSRLDPKAEYVLKIGKKRQKFRTDGSGNHSGVFTVPKGLKVGSTVEVAVVNGQGSTVKSAGLKIVAEGSSDKNPPAAGGAAEQTASGGDSTGASADGAGEHSSASSDEAKSGDSPLPRTGANIAGILAIAALLLAAGSAVAVYSRRKTRS